MASKDMGGMRGSGAMARGMGPYGKGGAKPSMAPKRPMTSKRPLKISDSTDRRLFEKKYNQLGPNTRIVTNKSTLSRAVKSERSSKANSPSNSPRQKPTPVKPSAKKGRR